MIKRCIPVTTDTPAATASDLPSAGRPSAAGRPSDSSDHPASDSSDRPSAERLTRKGVGKGLLQTLSGILQQAPQTGVLLAARAISGESAEGLADTTRKASRDRSPISATSNYKKLERPDIQEIYIYTHIIVIGVLLAVRLQGNC